MSKRREFLKTALLAAGAMALPGQGSSSPLLPEYTDDTESYWREIRRQFPLRHDRTFLNNGTIGPSPYRVIHTVQKDMLHVDESGTHGGGESELCRALARFLNTHADEISLTHNVTEGINIVCWGLKLKAGDEVLISTHEHVGNACPWINRAHLSGIKLVPVKLGTTAEETLNNIRSAITPKTKALSLPHIPCTIGQILPVKEICRLAKEKGIFSLIDGAHPPGMLQVDLKDIGCDAYAGCGHKWMLGPKGTGFLYVAATMRDRVQAFYGGAGMDAGWDLLSRPVTFKGYAPNGHRYYYGSQNASLYKGLVSAIEFQEAIGKERIENRVRGLATYLRDQLGSFRNDVEILTPREHISRGAQISFRLKNKDTRHFHDYCAREKIITRFVPENDINCLRISCHIYNNFEDLDTLLATLDKFIRS